MTRPVAFLFPGQGSQAIGMGADVFARSSAARHIFEVVDQALGFSLSNLCFHGPEDTLRETINAQPAIVTVSLALLAAFQEALTSPAHSSSWLSPLVPSYIAGHSVGEYAALVAASALDLDSAVLLVRERGRLMHHEGTVCPGGMAAVIGMDGDTLQAVCQEATTQTLGSLSTDTTHPGEGHVAIANFNAPDQIVISGEQRALALAMELAKARGAKRVIPLAVSGAFHSPVMQPAAAGLSRAIDATNVRDAELAQQIASSVQWTGTIEHLTNAGVTVFFEIGPGQALTGMVKRIARIAKSVTTINISNVTELEKAVDLVGEMSLSLEI